LGSDQQIAKSINDRKSALSQQLVNLANSYRQQLAQQQTAQQQTAETSGASSTPSDRGVELASWQQQANKNLSQAKRKVQTDLAQHRVQLVQQFRDQIKPYARQVAQKRGLSVIMTKNDTVVYDFSDSVDITADVVKAIRTNQPQTPVDSPRPQEVNQTTTTAGS
jgi:Skp family chaperone for outer membrane proteins